MNDYELIQKQILSAIDTRVKQQLEQLKYDYTITGVVQQVNDTTCVVRINGEDSNCKVRVGLAVAVGDVVNVVIPSGDFSQKYIDSKLGVANTSELPVEEHDHNDSYYTKTEVDTKINTYTHDQRIASSEWIIDHNLNRFPSVTIIDSGGSMVIGDLVYVSENQIKITFSAPFTGKAYIN